MDWRRRVVKILLRIAGMIQAFYSLRTHMIFLTAAFRERIIPDNLLNQSSFICHAHAEL
jgi:hypothetical protein